MWGRRNALLAGPLLVFAFVVAGSPGNADARARLLDGPAEDAIAADARPDDTRPAETRRAAREAQLQDDAEDIDRELAAERRARADRQRDRERARDADRGRDREGGGSRSASATPMTSTTDATADGNPRATANGSATRVITATAISRPSRCTTPSLPTPSGDGAGDLPPSRERAQRRPSAGRCGRSRPPTSCATPAGRRRTPGRRTRPRAAGAPVGARGSEVPGVMSLRQELSDQIAYRRTNPSFNERVHRHVGDDILSMATLRMNYAADARAPWSSSPSTPTRCKGRPGEVPRGRQPRVGAEARL
jgi:hypothetical protein